MVRYANRPGIIGRSEGKEKTSAGQWIIRAKKILNSPISVATINVDTEISIPDCMNANRIPCPMAARRADIKIALRDGLELIAKPIAVTAAITPSIIIN